MWSYGHDIAPSTYVKVEERSILPAWARYLSVSFSPTVLWSSFQRPKTHPQNARVRLSYAGTRKVFKGRLVDTVRNCNNSNSADSTLRFDKTTYPAHRVIRNLGVNNYFLEYTFTYLLRKRCRSICVLHQFFTTSLHFMPFLFRQQLYQNIFYLRLSGVNLTSNSSTTHNESPSKSITVGFNRTLRRKKTYFLSTIYTVFVLDAATISLWLRFVSDKVLLHTDTQL